MRDFGENRQNEARDKFPLVPVDDLVSELRPIYHHIGPLQSGASRQIPGLFDWVHGASSRSALEKLADACQRREAAVQYLIQVRLTDEESKAGGMEPAAIRGQDRFVENDFLKLRGFMTMGPESQDPTETREVFARLRELRDEILPDGELSMGMSGDWEIAVEEGATMIRIGSALFGTRGPGPWKPPE